MKGTLSVQGVEGGSKKEVALNAGFTEWVRCSLGNKVGRVFEAVAITQAKAVGTEARDV